MLNFECENDAHLYTEIAVLRNLINLI